MGYSLCICIHPLFYSLNHKQFLIQGITSQGKVFRPSDWIDRLCGVMATFRPADDHGDPRYTHSPYVRPETVQGIKCVFVDERLRTIDIRALDFVLGFAKDNDLIVSEICEIPQIPAKQKS